MHACMNVFTPKKTRKFFNLLYTNVLNNQNLITACFVWCCCFLTTLSVIDNRRYTPTVLYHHQDNGVRGTMRENKNSYESDDICAIYSYKLDH